MSHLQNDERFVAGDEHDWEPAGPGVRRMVLGHDEMLMLVRVEFEKGAEGAVHSHPHRQVTYVASGSFDVRIGDEKRFLKSGDSFFIPPGVAHGVVALEKGCLVDVFTPAREDFVNANRKSV